MVLEKTLESSLDCKEIKPVNPKGNQPLIFIGRTDAEVEASIFGYLMWIGKVESKRKRRWQRMKWLDSITDSMNMSLSKLWKTVENRGAWHVTVHGVARVRHDLVTEQKQHPKYIAYITQYKKRNNLLKIRQYTWIDIFPNKIHTWTTGTLKDAQLS